jgi:hypothetical protein
MHALSAALRQPCGGQRPFAGSNRQTTRGRRIFPMTRISPRIIACDAEAGSHFRLRFRTSEAASVKMAVVSSHREYCYWRCVASRRHGRISRDRQARQLPKVCPAMNQYFDTYAPSFGAHESHHLPGTRFWRLRVRIRIDHYGHTSSRPARSESAALQTMNRVKTRPSGKMSMIRPCPPRRRTRSQHRREFGIVRFERWVFAESPGDQRICQPFPDARSVRWVG